MEQCWRWFGPGDPISLQKIAQAGATGVVTALHEIPTGEVWSVADIRQRNAEIETAGLRWSVVESVPVHADIKKGTRARDARIAAYKQTICNLAEVGVGAICYNFMPIVDWTRMAKEFGERIHFVHLRNITREPDGSFYESDHLDGDNDLIGLVSTLLEQESTRRRSGSSVTEIPMRPDHGHAMGDELERNDVNPGYSYVGRLRGLAELRGVIRTLEWQGRGG